MFTTSFGVGSCNLCGIWDVSEVGHLIHDGGMLGLPSATSLRW
jgi:hypothetical protein